MGKRTNFGSCFTRHLRNGLLSLALAGGIATSLVGQIVNIEDRRVIQDSVGWAGQIDLGGNLTRNRNRVLNLNAELRLDRLTRRREKLLLLGSYRVVRAGQNSFLNAGFGHLRYGRELSERVSWEAFTQIQYDQQIQLKLRLLAGTGPRLRVADGDKAKLFIGLLYMREYNELRDRPLILRDHRLSNYLSLDWRINPQIRLNNTTYFQPRLPDFNQVRLSSGTSLQFNFTTNLSLRSTFNATLDERVNDIFPEVPALTFTWANGLRWRF